MDCKNMVGHLIAIFGCHSIEDQPDTLNPGKIRKVARIDYVDLDDGIGGEIKWGALVDKPGITNKLTVGMPSSILGRLGRGEAKAQQSPPFILEDHTPADMQRFQEVWLPPNRAALAGTGRQNLGPRAQAQPSAPQQAPSPYGTYDTPAPAYAPPPGQSPAQAIQQGFPGATEVAPPPQQPQQQPPAAPAGISPEALAAFQALVARGDITLPAT
jgi:hypothetical protein